MPRSASTCCRRVVAATRAAQDRRLPATLLLLLSSCRDMLWLKLLHISAVIVWCGSLLYLPLLIAAGPRAWPRRLFIGLATPAALLAIGSGTAIFLAYGPLAPWLALKLLSVALLALGHAACGVLLLRAERATVRTLGTWCGATLAHCLLWLAAIAWLVLRKPVW